MKRRTRSTKVERRASAEDPRVPVSAENFLAFFGVESRNLPNVTIDSALRVPAVAAAVAFLSRTLATLPLHAYRRTDQGPEKLKGKLQIVVHENPNDEMDSFKFRQYFWQQVFTGGRGLAWIERAGLNVEALWLLDPSKTTIVSKPDANGFARTVYRHGDNEYPAADVIDVPFMLRPNQVLHYGPITLASKAIQLALAMSDYAGNFFAGGGIPPLALSGPLPTGADAMRRAMADIHRSIDAAKKSDKPIFPMPPGHELKQVGFDPEKGQMTDARRFQVEEIARAYQLPPVFLQDLSRATFSNAEQQDLHLVKHLIGQWAGALEGELNLKLFGRMRNGRYVEHNLDGLMRGDFKSRIDALARGVQTSLYTPDEARELEGRPKVAGGDKAYMQGATVPLGTEPSANNGGQGDPGTSGDNASA